MCVRERLYLFEPYDAIISVVQSVEEFLFSFFVWYVYTTTSKYSFCNMLTYLLKYRYKNRPLFIQSSRVQFQFTSLNFTVHKRKSVKWMYICSPKKTNSFSLVLKITYCMHIMLMITSLCNSFAFGFTATLLRMFRIIKNWLPPNFILFLPSLCFTLGKGFFGLYASSPPFFPDQMFFYLCQFCFTPHKYLWFKVLKHGPVNRYHWFVSGLNTTTILLTLVVFRVYFIRFLCYFVYK